MTEKSSLWWLSFVGDQGFLGVCIVEAPDMVAAVIAAGLLGINPGGEVKGIEIPAEAPAVYFDSKNRLMDKAEINRLFGPL